ncbi:hypothetical protein J4442_01225 [Candidatus Woesearchaeota archaeon]|nr:hypothetical protein [Candidatus Woesearchaeota archaeon]
MVKIDDYVDEEDVLDDEIDLEYTSKRKLEKAVDEGDMEAEDALFMEGYLEEDE